MVKIASLSPTYSPPRKAPPPKIIPLFATAIHSRPYHPISLHDTLPEKPRRFRPYQRRTPVIAASDTPSTGNVVGSPLTPVPEEVDGIFSDMDTNQDGLDLRRSTRLISSYPATRHSLAELEPTLLKELRGCAKIQIERHLQVGYPLGEQETEAVKDVKAAIIRTFPDMANDNNSWILDAVLRDQLKSIKDTRNARTRNAKASRNASSSTKKDGNTRVEFDTPLPSARA